MLPGQATPILEETKSPPAKGLSTGKQEMEQTSASVRMDEGPSRKSEPDPRPTGPVHDNQPVGASKSRAPADFDAKYSGLDVAALREAKEEVFARYLALQQTAFRKEWDRENYTIEFVRSGEPRRPKRPGEIAQQRVDESSVDAEEGVVRIKVVTLDPEVYEDVYAVSDEYSWIYKKLRDIERKQGTTGGGY